MRILTKIKINILFITFAAFISIGCDGSSKNIESLNELQSNENEIVAELNAFKQEGDVLSETQKIFVSFSGMSDSDRFYSDMETGNFILSPGMIFKIQLLGDFQLDSVGLNLMSDTGKIATDLETVIIDTGETQFEELRVNVVDEVAIFGFDQYVYLKDIRMNLKIDTVEYSAYLFFSN